MQKSGKYYKCFDMYKVTESLNNDDSLIPQLDIAVDCFFMGREKGLEKFESPRLFHRYAVPWIATAQ